MRSSVIVAALACISCALPRSLTLPASLDFDVRLMPRFVMAGGAVWVTCYVPSEYRAERLRYGIEGIRMSEGPLEHLENRMLVERIPCGRWSATCALSTGEHRELRLEVLGDCDGDGSKI